MRQPIGILGGTFDPIHLGHIHLANKVINKCNLQYVILLPCTQSPLKSTPVASPLDRLEMIKLAKLRHENLIVDDYEIKQNKIIYTIDSLKQLRQRFKNIPICWIMGLDSFNSFTDWYKWDEILNVAHIVITNRPDEKLSKNTKLAKLIATNKVDNNKKLAENNSGNIFFVDIDPLPIASKDLRFLLKSNKNVEKFLNPNVLRYIKKHDLYKN